MSKELVGAQILLESLVREGTEVLFGYPGGAIIDIYHYVPDYPLLHILVRHEQGAVHAADGYARASGQVGVALVTSGPGATNAVTGIATAYMDSIPIVVLTGQVPLALIGNDAFQEVDILGITRPCTKHNYLVTSAKDLAKTIKEAFHVASTGRPGPVLVDIPKDVQQQKCMFSYPEKKTTLRNYNPHLKPHPLQVKRVAELLWEKHRTVILAGGGVIASEAYEDLAWLARTFNIPVVSTLMGLGCFPGNDPLWLGMLGMHGIYAANRAISEARLILALGVRFDDRATGNIEKFADQARIVHVDIDPTSIQKNISAHIPIVADCRKFLSSLRQVLESGLDDGRSIPDRTNWLAEIEEWNRDKPLRYVLPASGKISPQAVIEQISELAGEDTIICTEVGQHQMWVAQFYKFLKPRTLLSSGGLGTMGYGLPAAIGAQLAHPDHLVINVAGDGSIQMNIQELITAVCNQLPIKVIILNNGYLGMVRQWQELFYKKNYCATCLDAAPDFVKLAEAYGAVGYRVSKQEEVGPVLKETFANGRTTIVDVLIEPEENVYPIIPAGKTHREAILI